MSGKQQSFVISGNQSISELLSLLEKRFNIRELPESVIKRVYYDTFDWRLYKKGASLEKHEESKSTRIYWRAGKKDRLKILLGLNAVPHQTSRLPDSDFRDQLQSIISVRELAPRLKLKIKRRSFAVVDKNNKVVVRINIDKYLHNPSNIRAAKTLGKRLTITPVKGYPEEFQQLEVLLKKLKLRPAQDNMMKLALVAQGVNPADYTNKLNILLEPELPAEQAVKKILHRLLVIMQQNTRGSIKGRDTEFMHHYRVAIRKTRSAFKQIKGVLPKHVKKKYKKFFALLGKLTTPVRDLDVFLLKLEAYRKDLDKSAQKALQPFREYLLHSRAEAQKKFVEEMKSEQYREDIKQWQAYLESTAGADQSAGNANKPAYIISDELVWEVYQEAITLGSQITDESKSEALHELRKIFKKLRYLIEFFRSLYPTTGVHEITRALAGLQDNLGDYNDLDVHVDIIKEFISQSTDENAVAACQQIIDGLEQQQGELRTHFAEYYEAFASAENHDRFRKMFVDYHGGDSNS